ncbi:hypothetical protein PPL_04223 [Heterostelium album PN500]|uniref:Uncharacterized protein n=1 Tax=Heterostelium pallidum (strain ATCC 26659 / Pp 5 / PN500) TaxID=670386 RepID=D3B6Z2_HETP5|nr:hypothetical protein PPL_04223 [Heterostelium album PN500]EFA82535.1 hypothetical protein PPL_04223 [Heterostelium album PN500]|eukprot:XP_020434652.1 hypothetical protein PPL_04223 [Heterostelium album PN500]
MFLYEYDSYRYVNDSIDNDKNKKLIGDQLKPIVSDFLKNHKLSLPDFSFKDVFLNNKFLFEDDRLIDYLKSMCDHSDIANLIVISLLQSDCQDIIYLNTQMSKFNSWFDIESRVIDLLNNTIIPIASPPIAILSIVNINPTRINELSKHYRIIFQYLINPHVDSTGASQYNLISFAKYFSYFKEYYDADVSLKTQENVELLKSKLKYLDSVFLVPKVKQSFQSLYSLLSGFIKSELELFTLSSSSIEVESALKLFESFSDDIFQMPEFHTSIQKMLPFNKEQSLLVLDMYRSRALILPVQFYSFILGLYNNTKIKVIVESPLQLDCLIYLWSIERDANLQRNISHHQIFSEYDYKVLVKEHLHFLQSVAPYIQWSTMQSIFKQYEWDQLLSSDFADIIMLTSSPRETINEFILFRRKQLRSNNSHYTLVIAKETQFLLETDNLEFLSLYLEQLLRGSYELALLSTQRRLCIDQLIERLYQHKPESANIINHLIRSHPMSNILKGIREFKPYFSLHSDDNNSNSTTSSTNPTLSTFILKEIFKYLILDKNPKSRSIVSMSTISSQIHGIVSSILSNYPLRTISIVLPVPIGSKYCLLKNAPLHLTSREIQFIPYDHMHSCLQKLESYVQYFGFIDAKNRGSDKYYYYLANSTKIKHLAFREVRSCRAESDSEANTNILVFDSGIVDEKIMLDSSLFTLKECRDYYPDVEGNRNIILSDHEEQSHHMNVFLQHFDNDQLQSINFVGRNFKSLSNFRYETESLVHHTFSILSKLKQKKPFIDISFTVPPGVSVRLGFCRDYEEDQEQEQEVLDDEPVIPKEDYLLITKFKYDQYLTHTGCWPIELKNLTKFVTSFHDHGQRSLVRLIERSPNLYYIKIKGSLNANHFEFIKSQPTIKKLAFKLPIKTNSFKARNFPLPITLEQINLIFSTLEQAEYHSIRCVKLFILSNAKYHYPLINRYQLNRNLINLFQFKPINESQFKFIR